MAQDIRKLFKESQKVSNKKMPEGHEARFFTKLEKEFPEQKKYTNFNFLNIAASVVLLIGLGYFGLKAFDNSAKIETDSNPIVNTKSIGEVSPQLKKVEDYYLANINLELSKMVVTKESKELFDGYILRLDELNNEYNVLADELINSGPSERTVNALIDNLKLRLNLLYRLKEKLSELNKTETGYEQVQS